MSISNSHFNTAQAHKAGKGALSGEMRFVINVFFFFRPKENLVCRAAPILTFIAYSASRLVVRFYK